MKEKKTKNYQTSRTERFLYPVSFLGQNLLYGLVSTYFSIYLLQRGLTAAAVGFILLAAKGWDAINDPIFGVMIDKIPMKKGRFLPWLRIGCIGLPLSVVAIFVMPNSLPTSVKTIWALLAYMLYDSCYTAVDAPLFALATTMTSNVVERTSMLSFGRLTGTIGAILVGMILPMLYPNLGWEVTAILMVVVSAIMLIPISFTAKERCNGTLQGDPSLKEIFSYLVHNKYLLAFYFSFFIAGATNFVSSVIPILSEYVMGDATKGTMLSAALAMPMILVAMLVPKLNQKFTKLQLYVFGMVFFIVSSVISYFTGYQNETMLLVMMALRGVGYGFNAVLGLMFTPDCVEYGHYKTGIRSEGISFSLQTFISKLMAAVVSSLSMFILAAAGFEESLGAAQSAATTAAIWNMTTYIPAIGSAVSLVILFVFYKLKESDVQIMARYNNGELSREECDSMMARKY